MNFTEIAQRRQSCRQYQSDRYPQEEALKRILAVAALAPSACNGQPYQITVCRGKTAEKVAKETQKMGMNPFASQAPVLLVISEQPYVPSAALGAKMKHNDYRSIDIGILAAYITAAATEEGIASCILGWLEDEPIRKICDLKGAVRLVITLGYEKEEGLRPKKRKAQDELVKFLD